MLLAAGDKLRRKWAINPGAGPILFFFFLFLSKNKKKKKSGPFDVPLPHRHKKISVYLCNSVTYLNYRDYTRNVG